jgi:hypothetical protein
LRSLNSLAVIAVPSLRRHASLAICQPQLDVESKCISEPAVGQVEWLIFGVIVVAAIVGLYSLASGPISI